MQTIIYTYAEPKFKKKNNINLKLRKQAQKL